MKRKSNHGEPPGKKATNSALKNFDFSFGEAHLPNPVSTKVDFLSDLTEFFKNKGFSGTQHLDFAVSAGCKDTVGCYTKKAFRNGDTYFTVPQTCMIGLNVVLEHDVVKFIISTARKQGSLQQISVEQLFWTVMVMLKDDDNSTDNNHATYLHSLADISPSILNWDSSLRIVFADTNLQIALEELNQSLLQFIDLIHSLIPTIIDVNNTHYISNLQQLTYEKLLWAAGHYLSRRYPMHFAPAITAEQEQLLSELRREHNFGNIGTMVPFLDILNHSHDHDWLDMQVNDHGHLQVNCNRAVSAGQELFSNYGHLSNGQLLFAYGYAIENNLYDEYLLKLKLPGEGKNLFALPRGGWDSVPKELLVALKAMIGMSNSDNEEVVSDEESLEVFYSFLLDKMQKMKATHTQRAEHLRTFGITLTIPFPDTDEEDNELIIPPHMTKPTITAASTSSSSSVESVEVEKAKYIAYYLAGQFEVIMELLVDMSRMFSMSEENIADMDGNEEGDDDADDDDEDEQEEDEA